MELLVLVIVALLVGVGAFRVGELIGSLFTSEYRPAQADRNDTPNGR